MNALPDMHLERLRARGQLLRLSAERAAKDLVDRVQRRIAIVAGILVPIFLVGLLALEHAKGGPL